MVKAIKPNKENRKINIKKWLKVLSKYEFSESNITSEKAVLAKKFGKNASNSDAILLLFNKAILKSIQREGDNLPYLDIALFLNEEGKSAYTPFYILKKMQLNGTLRNGINRVEILANSSSCAHCKKSGGKILSIKEALEKMPLPNKSCTFKLNKGKHGWCRCVWLPVSNFQ